MSGDVQWRYQMGGAAVSKPLCRPGFVYAGSQDGYVYALNATTGELAWKLRTDGPVRATPGFGVGGYSSGVLYIASEDGNVYAVDARFGGLPYWQYSTSKALDSTPVATGDHLYFASSRRQRLFPQAPGEAGPEHGHAHPGPHAGAERYADAEAHPDARAAAQPVVGPGPAFPGGRPGRPGDRHAPARPAPAVTPRQIRHDRPEQSVVTRSRHPGPEPVQSER